MQTYKDSGDDWVRPQHRTHVWLFFLQQKDELASEIISDGGVDSIEASVDRIRELRRRGAGIYVDEASINRIGYALMNDGHVAEAIMVFKLNVEAFPESYNAHDSLGEAYMTADQNELAMLNYKKSLELYPASRTGKQALKKLGAE